MITTNIVYHYMITAINVVILAVLVRSFIKHYAGRSLDVNFHSRMLLLCTCLLAANTFAFITGLYGYYILKLPTPEIIDFGRFADRYMMLFSYFALGKIDQRY